MFDAVVVGSGPNGLAAAVALASRGHSVCLLEGRERIGGGLRSHGELESDFIHDHCAAIHPLGILSPFYSSLGLEKYGLRWSSTELSVAHPLLDRPAVLLGKSVHEVGARLNGRDAKRWSRLLEPFVDRGLPLFSELLAPPSLFPRHPLSMLRFAWFGVRSARSLATRFSGSEARALLGGLAAHSILPMESTPSAAVGLLFALSAHLSDWPCVTGGSENLARALGRKFLDCGGEIRTDCWVRRPQDLPPHRVALFDVSPRALSDLYDGVFPARYLARLRRFRYGPGTFKLDYTLNGPIPWRDPEVARASTVHVSASFEELSESERAPHEGKMAERPYLMVCQQSALDSTRAPRGKHTGYVYCHVPHGYSRDVSETVEAQLERFAPGFRDLVRARRVTTPSDFEHDNPNLVGGVVAGGVADWRQLFTRPVARLDPYSTPDPNVFLCSASTPPGGGVHGMCGYFAAQSALRRLSVSHSRRRG